MAWISFSVKTVDGWKEVRDRREAAAKAREAHKRDKALPDRPRAKVGWRDRGGEKRSVTVDLDVADDVLRRAVLGEDTGEDWDGRLVASVPAVPALPEALIAYLEFRARSDDAKATLRRIDSMMNVAIRKMREMGPVDKGGRPAVNDAGEPTVAAMHATMVGNMLAALNDHRTTAQARRRTLIAWWKWLAIVDPYAAHTRCEEAGVPRRKVGVLDARPAPTWDQMNAVIAAMRAAGEDRIADRLIIARYTGLRIDAVQNLLWTDVDLDEGVLRIRAENDKMARGRKVPMCEALIEHLRGLSRAARRADGRIVGGVRDSKVNAKIEAAWAATDADPDTYAPRKDRDGKEGKSRVNHTFRAGFMQGLRDLGVTDVVRKHLVGHRPPDTEGKHYSEPPWAEQIAAVALIPPIAPPPPDAEGTPDNVVFLRQAK